MAKSVRGGHEIKGRGIQVEVGLPKCQYFFEIRLFYDFSTHLGSI